MAFIHYNTVMDLIKILSYFLYFYHISNNTFLFSLFPFLKLPLFSPLFKEDSSLLSWHIHMLDFMCPCRSRVHKWKKMCDICLSESRLHHFLWQSPLHQFLCQQYNCKTFYGWTKMIAFLNHLSIDRYPHWFHYRPL